MVKGCKCQKWGIARENTDTTFCPIHRQHFTDGRLCWCDPDEVDNGVGGVVLVHRSVQ